MHALFCRGHVFIRVAGDRRASQIMELAWVGFDKNLFYDSNQAALEQSEHIRFVELTIPLQFEWDITVVNTNPCLSRQKRCLSCLQNLYLEVNMYVRL